jgi:hypothetical protein
MLYQSRLSAWASPGDIQTGISHTFSNFQFAVLDIVGVARGHREGYGCGTDRGPGAVCPVIHCGYPYTVYEDSQWISLHREVAEAEVTAAAEVRPILCFPCLPVPSVYCGSEGD